MSLEGKAQAGGLFRLDGGVKTSSGLDVSDPEIAETWRKVRDDKSEETWITMAVEKNKLKAQKSGVGGAAELLEAIDDEQVLFGGFRDKDGKFVGFCCVGDSAPGMARGKASLMKNAALQSLGGLSRDVYSMGKEDFTEKLGKENF